MGLVFHLWAAAYEELADNGLRLPGSVPDLRVVYRDITPTQEPLAFVFYNLLDHGLAGLALARVWRKEYHSNPILTRPRKSNADGAALPPRL